MTLETSGNGNDIDQFVIHEVGSYLNDTEALHSFYQDTLVAFLRNHDPFYQQATLDPRQYRRFMRKHNEKLARLQETYSSTLMYFAQLATGKAPTSVPSEGFVRDMFAALAVTYLEGNDYNRK